jgi:purine-binding chemotaxis protein CheW
VIASTAVVVPVGEDQFAVDVQAVREVVAMPSVTPLPLAPAWVLGVINVRGEVVPVLDTGSLMALGANADPAFAVVVMTSEGSAALAASAMPAVVTLGDDVGPSDLPATHHRHRFGAGVAVRLDVEALAALSRGDGLASAATAS